MSSPQALQRELGVVGAVSMGLGSIIGTGVFVSIGIAAGITGASVVLATLFAAFVATFNGLNSAQLAANHPVSGGTYEYGYRYLNPLLGFSAGWTFLLAKSASAATAALGFSGYLIDILQWDNRLQIPLSLTAVGILTLIAAGGIRRSNQVNLLILSITLIALAAFVLVGVGQIDPQNLTPFFPEDNAVPGFLQATALMFVAYTGYGRIATMGEEVREPRRTIPRAIVVALFVVMLIYVVVAFVGIGTVGPASLSAATTGQSAPLEAAARQFGTPLLAQIVTIGAITAMLSVLLNLILGLSRVLLAMGRRGDMPPIVARLDSQQRTPFVAVIVMGIIIAGLVLVGSVRLTWSFSAFTVLIYYAITNLAALQLKPEERLFPRLLSWCGLGACLFLAFWVEPPIWTAGLILIGVGLLWHLIAARVFARVR